SEGETGRPTWSPDGSRIAALIGDVDKYGAYDLNKLVVVPSNPPAGATARPAVYMASLDRAVSNPQWSADGQNISFLLQDDRTQHLARVPAESPSGTPTRLPNAGRSIRAPSAGKDGNFAVLATAPNEPAEVYALEGGALRKLTKHNDALLAQLQRATTEHVTSKSPDGTEVHGLIVKPAGYVAGRKYPTILYIHGGPNGQDEHAFSFCRQWVSGTGS